MNLKFLMQHTIGREVTCKGIGLHSGVQVSVRLRPAPPNFGVRFRRMDLLRHPTVTASANHVVDTNLATSIGANGATVSTIEHLMAAIYAKSIDNLLVELDGPEVPILDGSAAPFFDLLKEAGIKEQNAPRHCLLITRPILVQDGKAYIRAMPGDRFRVRYTIDFPHPLVGKQQFFWSFGETSFGLEIAKARTFGFAKDVEKLKSRGLALGGSLSNAIVFDDYSLLNHDGFRYGDECVRHKILDFVGDLALAGMPLVGHFEVYRAGHALHHSLLRQLFAKPGHRSIMPANCLPAVFYRTPPLPGFSDPVSSLAKCL